MQNVATDISVLDGIVFVNIPSAATIAIGFQLARHLFKISPSLKREFTRELEDELAG